MNNLYSLNNTWPQELPFRVVLADGTTRTDPSSFSVDELTAWGYTGPFDQPTFDQYNEILEWSGTAFSVRPMTTEERQSVLDKEWSSVRIQRNQQLANSDWTQLSDAPVDATPWAEYRQGLRDITTQDDPFDLTWPVQPS